MDAGPVEAPQQSTSVKPQPPLRVGGSLLARVMPWTVLAVWLSVHLAVVVYWATADWSGFLADLWLLLVCAGDVLGISVWLVAWSVLGDQRWPLRLVYFASGLAALAALTWKMFNWMTENESLAIPLAAVATGLALPMIWLRRRGRRIRVVQASDDRLSAGGASGLHSLWQFTIGDVLLTTTGAAIFLSLALIGGTPELVELVILAAQVLAATIVLLISLSWRRYLLAVPACFAVTLLIIVLSMAMFDPLNVFDTEFVIVAYYAAPALASLLIAIGAMRWFGYRLAAWPPR